MTSPLISIIFSGKMAGPLSFGRPKPSNTRPIISSETPSSSGCPKKRTAESFKLIPLVPSKICTKALSSCTSKTWPRRNSPFCKRTSISSSYLTPCTRSTAIKGPTTSPIVRYSLIIRHSSLSHNLLHGLLNILINCI